MDVNAWSFDMLGEMDLRLYLMLDFSSNQQKAAIYSRQQAWISPMCWGITCKPAAPI